MSKSIGRKIFIYMMVFSIIIVTVIGIGTKFILPAYYLNHQTNHLESTEKNIREAYSAGNKSMVISQMESIQSELGGDLYYYDETMGMQGYGMGKGRNRMVSNNPEKFAPEGDISSYTYTNKIGIDIYVLGVLLDGEYLVYEVSIQTLNRATDIMMNFIGLLLIFVFILALSISYILSRKISNPIRQLNKLAESMKTKKAKPHMVSRDSDEISQLNQTLNELYEELLGNIYQLNAELSKERNAEQLKKRFLAQATHELKTPIAVIRGYSEILYDGMYKDEEERDRYLKNIYDESESVSHLILDVLDYTKMETGNYKLNLAKVAIRPYFLQLTDRYGEYIRGKDLRFSLEDDMDPMQEKELDEDRFEQVYKNLISNAVEHAKSRVVTRIESMGEKIKLSVYNDGPDIDEVDLPNVFESFYKKKGKKSGSGLGLAIVKEIVLLHGGEYRVENVDGGVVFVIVL